MKQFLTLFLIVVFFKTTINCQISNEGNVWIVAVSIYHYQHNGIMTDLDYAVNGAYELSGLYDTRQLTYSTPITLTDRKARRSEILKTLESTFVDNPELTNADMILFYFSGHGETADGKAGICPYDYAGEVRGLITDEEIQAILQRSRARHKVCFIESCKTEVQSHEISDPSLLESFNQQRRNVSDGLVFITSTEAGKKSFGLSDIGGYFSHYLMRGLKGEADVNNDGFVTVEELFPFVRDNVKKLTQNQQIPKINDKGYDPTMPLMIIPSKLPKEPLQPPKPVQEPCAVNQTGDFCVENATGGQIWVRWNEKVTPIQNGFKECFYDAKAGIVTFRVTNYAPGGGSYTLGGASDHQVRVKACDTVPKVIR